MFHCALDVSKLNKFVDRSIKQEFKVFAGPTLVIIQIPESSMSQMIRRFIS